MAAPAEDLVSMVLFAKVVEERSFTAAAPSWACRNRPSARSWLASRNVHRGRINRKANWTVDRGRVAALLEKHEGKRLMRGLAPSRERHG
jgi:hypothetical protein